MLDVSVQGRAFCAGLLTFRRHMNGVWPPVLFIKHRAAISAGQEASSEAEPRNPAAIF